MGRTDKFRAGSQFERVLRTQFKEVLGDIKKKDKELRGKAAKHVKDKIAEKINHEQPSLPGEPPGKVSGNLLKGLAVKNGAFSSVVGFKKPGFHALILEFGAVWRWVANHFGRNESGSAGAMAPRPVLFPTMAEESATVKAILSERRD